MAPQRVTELITTRPLPPWRRIGSALLARVVVYSIYFLFFVAQEAGFILHVFVKRQTKFQRKHTIFERELLFVWPSRALSPSSSCCCCCNARIARLYILFLIAEACSTVVASAFPVFARLHSLSNWLFVCVSVPSTYWTSYWKQQEKHCNQICWFSFQC